MKVGVQLAGWKNMIVIDGPPQAWIFVTNGDLGRVIDGGIKVNKK